MTPTERMLNALKDQGCEPQPRGKGWSAKCPAHDDRKPSLTITEGADKRALIKCHAGCDARAVCEAAGLTVKDLMPTTDMLPRPTITHGRRKKANQNSSIVATYDYTDEAGKLLFQVVRYEPKDFRQRKPKPGGGWDWSNKDAPEVPYRLPELLAAPSRPVIIVEGEKDVDNLRERFGVLATCNAGGADNWAPEHSEHFRDRDVVLIADNDSPGLKHAQLVAQSLYGIATRVRVVQLPNLAEKGDVSDWIEAGGSEEEFQRIIKDTLTWTPDTASQAWPEIESFDQRTLPQFPTDALPKVLREWVEAESHATQTPADMAALLALAICAATIARRVEVEPRDGWREPVNLFTAILLEPGNRKSAVFFDAVKPLRELEAELIEEARPVVARAESEFRQAEARLKKLEKIAAEKDDPEAREEASVLAEHLAELVEPVLPRLIVDDATSEKLGMMLAQHDGRIASLSPEGGVFDLMAGMYSKSGIPQFGVYLMGHSGDDLRTDRVSRETVLVQRPALTCAYAMQPQVIKGLAENAAFRGRGLLARFLYAAPPSWIGHRTIGAKAVPVTIRDAYHQAVRGLAEIEGHHLLGITLDASVPFYDWETEIENMLADGGDMEIMRDWGSKLAGATLRIAAVLHLVQFDTTEPIDTECMAAAIKIARYLIPHAEAVLTMMQAKETTGEEDARYIVRWIKRHDRREFTKSEAQHHGKRRFPQANDIDPALTELERRGYIRQRAAEPRKPGRPPSPKYEVNPAIFETDASMIRSRNSQNPAGRE